MAIYDQLGLIRSETYRGGIQSEGIHYRQDTKQPYAGLHAKTEETEVHGETILVVRAAAAALIGETALYAAFVQQFTGENVVCDYNGTEIGLANLPRIATPHMSDNEVEERFALIEGTGTLTEHEKRQIIDMALLLNTHFNMRLNPPNKAPDTTLSFDDWPPPASSES